ncbi:MAG: HD domain-containing protein [Nitrospirae bacterium]|nr:MAG: HD domain-containing protein [Nitrospirota bacterium]
MARLNELVKNQGGSPVESADRLPPSEEKPVSFKSIKADVPRISMEQDAQLILEADQWYAKAEMELSPIVGAVRQAKKFSLDGITQVVQGFVDSLSQGDRLLVKAISVDRGGLVISNLSNTAIMSIKIGMGLKYAPDDLMRLGLAAILHDMGMCLIPDDVLNKQGPLNPGERDLIKRHPEQGAQAIRRLGENATWIADIVLQEHERAGGQGYPHGLKGAEISEYAQIIGVADTFEALLHARPHRKRFLPHEAVRELVVKEKASFPTRILKCLIQQFSVFPLGTRVQLNTGEIGEVVELHPQYPLRPIIKIYMDPGRVPLREPRLQDLSKTSLVHITEVVQDDQQE